jgi:hypothetical protein
MALLLRLHDLRLSIVKNPLAGESAWPISFRLLGAQVSEPQG